VLYCHLWPVQLYNIFLRVLTNGNIFEKKVYQTLNVFLFSLQLLSETFLIIRTNERDMTKTVYWSSGKVPFIFVGF